MMADSSDRRFLLINAFISASALSFLTWLLFVHQGVENTQLNLRFLPPLNACFNGAAALLLIGGRIAIRRRRADLHRTMMLSAFAVSACFLIGYVMYHAVHGDTKFGGEGLMRVAYLTILASHIALSVFIVPMALAAFWFARQRNFVRHTKVTRWLHPIWLYVSLTGVTVFFMLRPYYPA
jgi:putative membrane protein